MPRKSLAHTSRIGQEIRARQWSIAGGKCDEGESAFTNAKREVHEETGLKIDDLDYFYVTSVTSQITGRETQFHIFGCVLETEPKVILDRESIEYGWFTRDEARKLDLVENDRASLDIYFTQKHSAGVIVEHDQKLFFMRRALTKKWEPGKWNFVGGRLDPGETPAEAAIRECQEEAGISCPRGQLQRLGIVDFDEHGVKTHFHLFICHFTKKPHPTMNSEHIDHGWFTLDQAKKLDLIHGEDISLDLYQTYLRGTVSE